MSAQSSPAPPPPSHQADSNIDPSLEEQQQVDPPLQEQQPVLPQPTSPFAPQEASQSPTIKRRRSGQSLGPTFPTSDVGLDHVVEDGSPNAKRIRPNPVAERAATTTPTPSTIHHEPIHPIVPIFSPQTINSQPPTAPMVHTAPMSFQPAPSTMLPPPPPPARPMQRPISIVLPPKHTTASSLTGYLDHIITKHAASFVPSTINTSFSLPWDLAIPRQYLAGFAPPGKRRRVPIRDLLYKFRFGSTGADGGDGGEGNGNQELEALVSLAKQSMDNRNCLMEISTSIVKMLQDVDGYSYVLSSGGRSQSPGTSSGTHDGMLGGNWEFTFVCANSEESRSICPKEADQPVDGPEVQKYFACEGKITVKFLEKEEMVLLRYRHCSIHRSARVVQTPAVPTASAASAAPPPPSAVVSTPAPVTIAPPAPIMPQVNPERTIVGGVVSRKPVESSPTTYAPAQALYANGHASSPVQTQSNDYVLHNGAWYLPQAAQPDYRTTLPVQTTNIHQHYQSPATTHHTDLSANPGQTMEQMYQQQYQTPSEHDKTPSAEPINSPMTSSIGSTTEQRLFEELSRELNSTQHTSHSMNGGDYGYSYTSYTNTANTGYNHSPDPNIDAMKIQKQLSPETQRRQRRGRPRKGPMEGEVTPTAT